MAQGAWCLGVCRVLLDEADDVVAGKRAPVRQYFRRWPPPPGDLAESQPRRFLESPFQMPGRDPSDYLIRRHVTRNDRPGCDDCTISDRDAAQDDDFARDPNVIADNDRPVARCEIFLIIEDEPLQPWYPVPAGLAEEEGRTPVRRVDAARYHLHRLVDRTEPTDEYRGILRRMMDQSDGSTRRLFSHDVRRPSIKPDDVPQRPSPGCPAQPLIKSLTEA